MPKARQDTPRSTVGVVGVGVSSFRAERIATRNYTPSRRSLSGVRRRGGGCFAAGGGRGVDAVRMVAQVGADDHSHGRAPRALVEAELSGWERFADAARRAGVASVVDDAG